MLLELELRMLMDFMTDRNNSFAVVINRAADFTMSVHKQVCSLNAGYSLSSTDDSNYPNCGRAKAAPNSIYPVSETSRVASQTVPQSSPVPLRLHPHPPFPTLPPPSY